MKLRASPALPRAITALGLLAACLFPSTSAETLAIPSWTLDGPGNLSFAVDEPQKTVLGVVTDAAFPNNGAFFGQTIYSTQGLLNPVLYNQTWVYSSSFPSPAGADRTILTLQGVNYRANAFLNGHLVADNNTIVGPFREFSFDVTEMVKGGGSSGSNELQIEVQRQFDRSLPASNRDLDLGITYVDWAPQPVDGSMGLWRGVQITALGGDVQVSAPAAYVTLPEDGQGPNGAPGSLETGPADPPSAAVVFGMQLKNWNLQASISGVVVGSLVDADGIAVLNFSTPVVTLQPGGDVLFKTESYTLASPRLWWPWQMGQPHLYSLTIAFSSGGAGAAAAVSDQLTTSIGLRTASNLLNKDGYAFVLVNGWPLLIRGGGWSPDLFLRQNASRMAFEVGTYTKQLGLNAIRLEGKMEQDFFYQMTDAAGVLALPGWCCCDAWQHWPWWTQEQYFIANESMRTQARRLRSFASVVAFFISSDELPPADVEGNYRAVLAQEGWAVGVFSAAAVAVSPLSGSTGVKMSGPYSWVPPSYFFLDKNATQHPSGNGGLGGGWGFLTEGGPGEAPMTLSSLTASLPEDEWWPPVSPMSPDFCWGHCGNPNGLFGSLKRFNNPLIARYAARGLTSTGLTDSSSSAPSPVLQQYLFLSQMAVYESHRAFFEAYTRNRFTYRHWTSAAPVLQLPNDGPGTATGLVQWMLNSPWPSNIWHLYDWWLRQGSGFFAVKKSFGDADKGLALIYGYDDSAVWLSNNLFAPVSFEAEGGAVVVASLYSLNGSLLFSQQASINSSLPPDSSIVFFSVPSQAEMRARIGPHQTYLLRLQLFLGPAASLDGGSGPAVENGYWLSTDEDVLEWSQSTFYNTPCSSFGNYSSIWDRSRLPLVTAGQVQVMVTALDGQGVATITVMNKSPTLAFFLAVDVEAPGTAVVISLTDNYLPFLLAGESRNLTAMVTTLEDDTGKTTATKGHSNGLRRRLLPENIELAASVTFWNDAAAPWW